MADTLYSTCGKELEISVGSVVVSLKVRTQHNKRATRIRFTPDRAQALSELLADAAALIQGRLKFCPDCKRTKPHGAFHVEKRRSDGLCGYCKECKRKRNRVTALAYYHAHKEAA